MSKVMTAINAIMAKVGTIKKEGRNEFHKYDYAAVADVLYRVQPLMAEEGLIILQSEKDRAFVQEGEGLAITYQFLLSHKSGEVWPSVADNDNWRLGVGINHTGLASARNSKGGLDDKASNKCHTAARKYFLLALFQIPTGDYDDADHQEDRGRAPKAANDNSAPARVSLDAMNPRVIMADTGYIGYGADLISVFKQVKTAKSLDLWFDLNKAGMQAMNDAAPRVHDKVVKEFTAAQDRLYPPQKIAAG